jgi:hypothetical protein
VVGVRLVVERRDLAVACRPVQADRLVQGAVGFQPDGTGTMRRGPGLELGQQPSAQPQPADPGRDPHPLDLRRGAAVELERTAPDRLAVQRGQQEQSRGRGHLVLGGGDAPGWVETALEAARQLGDVGLDGPAGVRVPRVAHGDLDG